MSSLTPKAPTRRFRWPTLLFGRGSDAPFLRHLLLSILFPRVYDLPGECAAVDAAVLCLQPRIPTPAPPALCLSRTMSLPCFLTEVADIVLVVLHLVHHKLSQVLKVTFCDLLLLIDTSKNGVSSRRGDRHRLSPTDVRVSVMIRLKHETIRRRLQKPVMESPDHTLASVCN